MKTLKKVTKYTVELTEEEIMAIREALYKTSEDYEEDVNNIEGDEFATKDDEEVAKELKTKIKVMNKLYDEIQEG